MTKGKYKLPLLWGIFSVYAVLTLFGALNHEVWLDEAQAWLILRDAPLSELPRILNVEGHPPLWYVILYPFVKLGFPTEYASLISWLIMAAGALVLLFKVELPLPLKAVTLFSSGFLYYNSVMLRVYSLIPPLLFLILWVYPNRRKRPVLYGLLIALLANTHLFVCGIVGMLGIFMLYELFSEWKNSPKKENIGKLFGLAVAGMGVLILVVPLIGSTSANGAFGIRAARASLNTFLTSFDKALGDAFYCTVLPFKAENFALELLLSTALKIVIVIMLAALRHWRKALAVELSFLVFYSVICGAFWTTLGNRAAVFWLSFAFALGLARYEEPVFKDYKLGEKITGKMRSLLERLIKADKKSGKIYAVFLFVCFAASIPLGAVFLVRDTFGEFSGSKQTAEYIAENLEEDAVIVHLGVGMPEISFYDPDIRIFSADSCDFTSYAKWEYSYRPAETAETLLETLSAYEHLYLVYYYYSDGADGTFYISDGVTTYEDYHTVIALCDYGEIAVEGYIERLKELNEEKGHTLINLN